MPHFLALLNVVTIILLLLGWRAIRSGNPASHKRSMGSAMAVSVLFVTSYVLYHMQVGIHPYEGAGWSRTVYYTILITHVLAALTALLLVPITFALGLRVRLPTHRRLAAWAMPIWLYASFTGLVVYWMIYH
ncbi:MAG: DUF420 domain-containing protein [Magnetococcales bacterium]|nr:DUF420 domain-containing protein [Magnetococcales bacterium]